MLSVNGKIKKKYGIVDERKELNELLLEWTNALGGKRFLNGDHVTLPDLMVFGVLKAIAGLTTFDFIMESNSELLLWYSAVDNAINKK